MEESNDASLKEYIAGSMAVGQVSGLVLAGLRGESIWFYTAYMGLNGGLLGLTYFGLHEGLKQVQPQQEVWNAVGAGAGTGMLWGTLQGGLNKGLRGSLLFSTLGLMGHIGGLQFDEYKRRWAIERYRQKHHLQRPEPVNKKQPDVEPIKYTSDGYLGWLPLYKVSEDEIEERVQARLELEWQERNSIK